MAHKFTPYNDRVQLQDLVETTDAYGQPVQTWTRVADFWAQLLPLHGRELINVRQVWPTASYFVSFNWQGPAITIKPKMRLLAFSGSKVLNILYANQVPIERTFELLCEEYVQP